MFDYSKCILLVEPFGYLVASKKKTIIIKSRSFDIANSDLLLIESHYALGIVRLDQPIKINTNEFKKLYNKHLISEKDKNKWWKDNQLYAYNVIKVKKFAKPQLIYYKKGPQVIIKNIQFIFIGTSGFYKNLDVYSQDFTTVELNVTFYRNLTSNMINNFNKITYNNFIFSIKMNRLFTHFKKLNNIEDALNKFISSIKSFKKVKVLLFQFNSNFLFNESNFNKLNILNILKLPLVFEFRDVNWFNKTVFDFMKTNNWSIVITYVNNINNWSGNLKNGFNPSFNKWVNTNDILYIRMHGYNGKYIGSHQSIFNNVSDNIKKLNTKYNFIYFNNTDSIIDNTNTAIYDAKKLIQYFE